MVVIILNNVEDEKIFKKKRSKLMEKFSIKRVYLSLKVKMNMQDVYYPCLF